MRVLKNYWQQTEPIKKTADIIGLCIILAGLCVSILMNCVGRSLWLDEAMLAYSFSERSFFGLTEIGRASCRERV